MVAIENEKTYTGICIAKQQNVATAKQYISAVQAGKESLRSLEKRTQEAFQEMMSAIELWKQSDSEDVDKYFYAVNKLKEALILAETLEVEHGLANGTIKFN